MAMKLNDLLNHKVWDSKAWTVLERIVSLIGLVVLVYGVYASLLVLETKQAEQSSTLSNIELMIKSQMEDPANWNKANQLMNP